MKKETLFAPFLLALFPVVFLFAHNREEVLYGELVLPLLAALLSAFGIFLVALLLSKILKKDQFHACFVASLIVVAFWYYGFFYEEVHTWFFGSGGFLMELSRQKVLLPLWLGTFGVFILGMLRVKFPWRDMARMLNVFALILLLLPFGTLAVYELTHRDKPKTQTLSKENIGESVLLPDIYYIIPDGYANSSVMKEFFGYDNTAFHSFLKERGFIVVEESRSNYPSTRFSIPSTLNMEYLSSNALAYTRELAEHNQAIEFLKGLGYMYVFIGSGSSVIAGENADIQFTHNDFYRIVQNTTILGPFIDPRARILDAFKQLEKVVVVPGPKIVVAHILIPHVPYIFGPNGEYIGVNHPGNKDLLADMPFYLGQYQFATKKLQIAVEEILSSSSTPPVIMIQSDHGVYVAQEWVADETAKANNQLRNFAAFFVPEKARVNIPRQLSAVNAFRLIFDLTLGTNFGLLEDRFYPSGTSF